jgi:hypothetical protein
VDGLAGGAVLAGIAPKGEGVEPLLWPGATLEFENVQLNDGLRSLLGQLPKWSPQQALHNYTMALRKLDWRWRFKILAESFGVAPSLLISELSLLGAKADQMATGVSIDLADPQAMKV